MATGTGHAIRDPGDVAPAVPHKAIVSAQGTTPEWEVVAVYDRMAGAMHPAAVERFQRRRCLASSAARSWQPTAAPRSRSSRRLLSPNSRSPQWCHQRVHRRTAQNSASRSASATTARAGPATDSRLISSPPGMVQPVLARLPAAPDLSALEAGAAVTVSMQLTAPNGTLDRPHTLTITVNPGPGDQGQERRERSAERGHRRHPSTRLRACLLTSAEHTRLSAVGRGFRPTRRRVSHLPPVRPGRAHPRRRHSFVPGSVSTKSITGAAYRYVITAYTAAEVDSESSAIGELRLGDMNPPRQFLPLIRATGASGAMASGNGTATSCTEQALDQALAQPQYADPLQLRPGHHRREQ